ncbi:MAG TPA: hypothetical protein VGD95_07400 [Micavibrio sp.]
MIIIHYTYLNLQPEHGGTHKRTIELNVRNDIHKSYTLNLHVAPPTLAGLENSHGEELLAAIRETGLDIESITRADEKGKADDSPEGAPAWQTFSREGQQEDIHRRNGKIVSVTQGQGPVDGTQGAVMRAQNPDVRNSSINFLKHISRAGRELLGSVVIEKNGKKCDGPQAEPAVTKLAHGNVTSYEHYKKGVLHNSPDGDAAKRAFHDNGQLSHLWYYHNGKLGNGPKGEAGEQSFFPDGQLYRRQYFHPDFGPDGRTIEELFNRAGTLTQRLSVWQGPQDTGISTVSEDFSDEGMRKVIAYLPQGPFPADGLSMLEFHPNGQPKRVVFAAQERFTAEFHYDDAGKLSQEVRYQYDEDGQSTRLCFDADGKPLMTPGYKKRSPVKAAAANPSAPLILSLP